MGRNRALGGSRRGVQADGEKHGRLLHAWPCCRQSCFKKPLKSPSPSFARPLLYTLHTFTAKKSVQMESPAFFRPCDWRLYFAYRPAASTDTTVDQTESMSCCGRGQDLHFTKAISKEISVNFKITAHSW